MKTFTLFLIAAAACAQPVVSNGRVESKQVNDVRAFVRDVRGPAWAGWSVPSTPQEGNSCWDNNSHRNSGPSVVRLEGSRQIFVLIRIENGDVGKLKAVADVCPLDAGGLPFYWLTGVSPSASLEFLASRLQGITEKQGEKKGVDEAMVAIAMHADAAADRTLERYADTSQPEWLREKALFWLASARGAEGFRVVRNVARNDSSARVREKTMFHLSIAKQPEAVDELIHAAKNDSAPQVRGQALFWLAQKAGQKAAATMQNAIENDPDTEVKKKAVFAIQQLPADEGVPLLIKIARENRNAEVRKQAMFWLGQTKDPRALAYFQEILR